LRECCDREPDIRIVGEYANSAAALAAVRAQPPDLLFLDVQMTPLTGIAVARALDPAALPLIVFVTAYDRFALAAFEVSAVDYLGADLVRNTLARQMAEFHRNYDLLVTPMMPVPALPVGQDLNDPATERHWIDWSPFSYAFNLTRQPAASIPCGLTRAGLPIGLQIVGPLYADDRVLRAARAFETTQPHRRPLLAA